MEVGRLSTQPADKCDHIGMRFQRIYRAKPRQLRIGEDLVDFTVTDGVNIDHFATTLALRHDVMAFDPTTQWTITKRADHFPHCAMR